MLKMLNCLKTIHISIVVKYSYFKYKTLLILKQFIVKVIFGINDIVFSESWKL